jgi:hypothetical protein
MSQDAIFDLLALGTYRQRLRVLERNPSLPTQSLDHLTLDIPPHVIAPPDNVRKPISITIAGLDLRMFEESGVSHDLASSRW